MPRAAQVFRLCSGVYERLHRLGAVVCTDTCGAAMSYQVYRHGKRRLVQHGIVFHHQVQLQLGTTALGERGTDKAPAMFRHEVDDLWCYIPGGSNKVTLVLAVFVVYYYQ